MPLSPSAVHNLEQQVPWKPSQVYVDLQKACRILNERGLKLSAKWAAEQWMGLPAMDDNDNGHNNDETDHSFPNHHNENCNVVVVTSSISDDLLLPETSLSSPILTYAKTLLDLGEFAHAAAILSQGSSTSTCQRHVAATVERMPPPLVDLNPAAFALRAYALYMAGERRKEEDYIELKRYGRKKA
jgi:Anaphase promoting complex subunit 8 / Cdc23